VPVISTLSLQPKKWPVHCFILVEKEGSSTILMAEDLKKPRMNPARLVHSDSRNQKRYSKNLRTVRKLLPLVIQIFTDKFFY
jgi:hypothetical protein